MSKVAVIGMGRSGESSSALLKSKGYEVICFDKNPSKYILPDNMAFDVTQFEFAVVSPGVPPSNQLITQCESAHIELISEIELALRFMSTKKTLIGITGTNGKTTVTQMVTHCLNFFGMKAHAVSNIGRPLSDAIDDEAILVIELSSFQLERTLTPLLDVAILLQITPDHLDRYATFVEYGKTKAKIANLLKKGGSLVLHKETCQQFPELQNKDHTHLIGFGHRQDNDQACIAALSHFGKTSLEVQKALSTFKAPPHRMEWIREIDGVNYYNDSKATNIDSVLYALKRFKGPIHLIAGGIHKGHPYTSWKPLLEEKVKQVYLIGEACEKIATDIQGSVPIQICQRLDRAIELASLDAQPGSIVLLSPGCSSFDQFKNYEDRGLQFKDLVQQL